MIGKRIKAKTATANTSAEAGLTRDDATLGVKKCFSTMKNRAADERHSQRR